MGRGFSSLIKTPRAKWIMIDLGASDDFNPVIDFLAPRLKAQKGEKKEDKYVISQLIITHPHDDHMACIRDFDKHIYPLLLTVPNNVDHPKQPNGCKVNWSLIKNPSDDLTNYLCQRMLPGREPPLRATKDDDSSGFYFKINYLKPQVCEKDDDLSRSNYANNISIMVRLNYKGNVVLFCGDIMKDGMIKIIELNQALRAALSGNGIDYLVAPHHGLRSSFPVELFNAMKDKRTRSLNIISERPTRKDSDEIVDDRYDRPEYCLGINNLKRNSGTKVRHVRTSASGHICIILFESKRSHVTLGDKALSSF